MSILQGKRPERPEHPTFSDELWSLIQRCWDDAPNSRPPASSVLETLEVLTCGQLANHVLTRPEGIRLINAMFSDHDWTRVITHVGHDHAQDFLDAVYGVGRYNIFCV